MIELLTGPWELVFMQRAFVVGIVAAVMCGVVGSYVVLRGMAFIGDAVSHSVFPGVAVSYVVGGDLVLGGAVAGVATALIIAAVSQSHRLSQDSVIGVFFAFAFGLGIVLVSTQKSYTGDLSSFLFGQVLGISNQDTIIVTVVAVILIGAALLLRRPFTTVSLDRETARAAGLPVFLLEIGMYVLVTIAIVMSVQAVGNILVLGLLITPAAAARLLTDRFGAMMVIAAAIGCFSAVLGLYLSYYLNLAAGGLIVVVLTGVFVLAGLLSPRHGLLVRRLFARTS
jgi:manganese/iron transport system permease protein